MAAISPQIVLLVLASAVAQVLGVSLLPATKGFTAPLPTLALGLSFGTGFFIMARLINAGLNLGILVPILTVLVPMGAVMVGIFYYHEPTSMLKLGILFVACCLIGAANMV